MNIIGLLRVRNEAEIILHTLDNMAFFCDFVIVYDDCSTDDTVLLCRQHPLVRSVIIGAVTGPWDKNRKRAEYENRQWLLHIAQKNHAEPNDWFVYQDADEFIEWDFSKLRKTNAIAVRMKLFDYYITPEDVDDHFLNRKYLGPEYRNILMAFRNDPRLSYDSPDQREVHLNHSGLILEEGFVKHYGKAVSVDEWEKTCEYYGTYFPKYSAKWNARRGKAIHTTSSFGMPLIQWHEKEAKGVLLTKEIEQHNIYGQ